ncbi:hypothetical protein LEP1GSC016_1401 [Leptospira borgpetersenii serovar Hardjo-bovis str. Sponselee]|uniref:Uncharacterized protein n=1 Tax=Leptospira borgpetersenii serovar Hardjo-bovis str. Sponselee TaxID=1303729 RepID=M6C2I1_LEPBO|nr:hypothetical protein LEP1GSC016_1401 [Leptospira borgpetersenii serovar Hardjo-bovis str. Sponselee]
MRIRFLSRRYSSLNFLKFRIILDGSFGRRKDFLSECFLEIFVLNRAYICDCSFNFDYR